MLLFSQKETRPTSRNSLSSMISGDPIMKRMMRPAGPKKMESKENDLPILEVWGSIMYL